MKRIIILCFITLCGFFIPSIFSQLAYGQSENNEVSFTMGDIRFTIEDGGVISCEGFPSIGNWKRCPYDRNVLLLYVGHPYGDGLSGCILKDNRLYYITAGSEEFEVRYFPNTDTMAAIWWNDEIQSGYPSEFHSFPITGNSRLLSDEKNIIYTTTSLDVAPIFPSERKGLNQWIKDNITDRGLSSLSDLKGSYFVNLIISKEGEVKDVAFPSSISNETQQAIIRNIIKTMPKWIPGLKNGKNVKCSYPVQLIFNLPPAVNGI